MGGKINPEKAQLAWINPKTGESIQIEGFNLVGGSISINPSRDKKEERENDDDDEGSL